MITSTDELCLGARVSCTIDEAIAKLLGWMIPPWRLKNLSVTEDGIDLDQLPHMLSLPCPLDQFIETEREFASVRESNAAINGDEGAAEFWEKRVTFWDHHIKLLRRAFNLAVQWEFMEKNVLKGIKLRLVDNELHDVADDEQLQRLVEVLRTDENRPVSNILMFLLSTGARLNEALQAKWSQVDLDKGLWTIPASNAKSKRGRTVPLNESAMYVLAEAAKQKQFEVIFANPATGKPFTTITRVWYRLCKAAGISQMRIHSLRHQFASLIVSSGRSLFDVQVLLGHSDPRVSQRYAKLSVQALKEASSCGSIIVPKPQSAPPSTRDAATPQQSVEGEIAAGPVSSTIVEFPKAA